jgi:uncharacterized protein
MELIRKDLDFDIRQAGAPGDRILEFVGSTAHVDRYGDVIEVEGWDLRNYKKNPVFLWAHDYRQPPVGKAVKVEKTDKGLLFRVKFPTPEEYPFADTVFKLYLGGYLKATSVGFQDLEREPITDKEGKQIGWRFKKQELYELSAVPVPANPQALIMAVQKGVVSPGEVETLTGVPFEERLVHEAGDEEDAGAKEVIPFKDYPADPELEKETMAALQALGGEKGLISFLLQLIAALYDWLAGQKDSPPQVQEILEDLQETALKVIAAGVKKGLREFFETEARSQGHEQDIYSLALNPGFKPQGGRPAGEPDIAELLTSTQKLHQSVKGGSNHGS